MRASLQHPRPAGSELGSIQDSRRVESNGSSAYCFWGDSSKSREQGVSVQRMFTDDTTQDPSDAFFFDEPAKIARNHQFVNVPLLIGGTLDEGTDLYVLTLNYASFYLTLLNFPAFPPYKPTPPSSASSPKPVQDSHSASNLPPLAKLFKHSSTSTPTILRRDLRTEPVTRRLGGEDKQKGARQYLEIGYSKGQGESLREKPLKQDCLFGELFFSLHQHCFSCLITYVYLFRSYQYAQPGFWAPQFGVGHFADVQMIFRWFNKETPREMIELSNTILSYWFASIYDCIGICTDMWSLG